MAYDPLPPHALIFKYGKLQIGVTGMGIVALVLLAAGFSAGRYLGLWWAALVGGLVPMAFVEIEIKQDITGNRTMIGEEPTPPPLTKYQLFEDENVRTGAKWGIGIGGAVAILVMNGASSGPPGFYSDSVMLLLLVCMGGGLLAGVTYGWYISKRAKESGEFHD